MSTDNRTEINDCDATTGFVGDGPISADSTTGFFYEGTAAISTQHTNTDEHIYTTEDSLNGGTFSLDWSDSTVYIILKDNLVQTEANGGIQIVLGDGTDRVGYAVGGNDNTGIQLGVFWNGYKLDVTEIANVLYTNTYAGVLANLTTTAITEVGLGTVHLAKAQGNVDNIKLDSIKYIANGSPALTINGGTVGTPETMTDVAGDDITNGWGLVSNPQGGVFNFFGPTEWGDAGTASSYFTAAGEQWFWQGYGVGATHFDFGLTANATGTNSFVLENVVIVNIDTRAAFDLAPANHDIMKLDSVTFTELGAISFPTVDATNKWANSCTFNNCDQVDPSTITMDSPTFNGTTDANGALLVAASTDNITGATFNSDGTGHAIYITATGTYNFTDFTYNGYGATTTTDAVVYNDSGGAVTINVSGGDTPTYRNGTGASTTVTASYTLTLTDIPTGVNVTIVNSSTRAELQHSTSTGTDITYVHGGAGTTIDILLNSLTYDPNLSDVYNLALTNANTSIKFQMIDDPNYVNP